MVNRFRAGKGIKVIEVSESPFTTIEILRHLRQNGVVAMLGDRVFFGEGKSITFFGRKARFPVGPVVLAMKSGAALIPAFVLRQSDGRYFAMLEQPIPLVLEGERDAVIKENLEKTGQIFEKYIRSYPDQWYSVDPITG